jgi:hypothetical protein
MSLNSLNLRIFWNFRNGVIFFFFSRFKDLGFCFHSWFAEVKGTLTPSFFFIVDKKLSLFYTWGTHDVYFPQGHTANKWQISNFDCDNLSGPKLILWATKLRWYILILTFLHVECTSHNTCKTQEKWQLKLFFACCLCI